MPSHQAYIPDSQLEHLRQLVGSCVGNIYSKALDVWGEYMLACDLSLDLYENKFIDFHNKHLFTKAGLFCGQLSVVKSDEAREDWDIQRDEQGTYSFPSSRIWLEKAWCMSRVEVHAVEVSTEVELSLEERAAGKAELIQFDRAIVFYKHGAKRFCISPARMSADVLWVSFDDQQIDAMIRRCTLRWFAD